MPPRDRRSKPQPYGFNLKIDSSVCARFKDASGLDVPHGTPRTRIMLKHGVAIGPVLLRWRTQGNVPLKDGSLIMLDATGAERGRWRLQGSRISKWIGPGLNAKGSNVAVELLELTCERIEEE